MRARATLTGSLILAALLVMALGCSDDEVVPEDIWPAQVLPGGGGDFPTIQSAINAAVDGDTVLLAAGTFTGPGNRNIDFLGKRITVMAEPGPRGAVIIDCEGDAQGFAFHSQEGAGTRLVGVTIANGRSEFGGGAIICTDESSPTISDCEFLDCVSAYYGGALLLEGHCESVISGCRFSRNRAEGIGGGVMVQGSSPQFIECVFDANTASSGGGVGIANSTVRLARVTVTQNSPDGVVCDASDLTLTNTIIVENSPGAGFACGGACTALLTCCDVWGNGGGDWAGCIADQAEARNNFSADPLFCDRMEGDFRVLALSPCATGSGVCGQVGALETCN